MNTELLASERILGIDFANLTMDEALDYAVDLSKKNNYSYIFTPNSLMIEECIGDNEFKRIINSADMNIPDGQGIIWASKKLRLPLKEKIAGVEFAEKLIKKLAQRNGRLFIIGGSEENLNSAVKNMKSRYPRLYCEGLNGYFSNEEAAIKQINDFSPDIVFVCFGSPKQEYFIYKNREKFKKGLFIGLGGTVDILSGNKKRAPKIFISLSLEWLWRALIEPKRFRKLFRLPLFIIAVLKEKQDI